MQEHDEHRRQLSDADVEAVVREFRAQMLTEFYGYVGKGIVGAVTAPLFWLLLLLAVAGWGWANGAVAHQSIIGSK